MTLRRQRAKNTGQTLVIAIIILGVLIILGFAFAAIITRNVNESGRGRRQSLATDLARAGAEYAHYQLRYSAQGADWRPAPTPPVIDALGFTRDPDALFLRPGDAAFAYSSDPRLANIPDLGGPDGYGPYSRVMTDRGRTLVRVRYAPFAYDTFANPNGQLREPSKARNYLTIEVVGRPGLLRQGSRIDPSLQLPESVKIANFANLNEKTREIGRLKNVNNTLVNTRRMVAFASIGMLETARFIHNKDRVTRPMELGWPTASQSGQGSNSPFEQAGLGVPYGDGQAPFVNIDDIRPVNVGVSLGRRFAEPNGGQANNWTTIPGLGTLFCNADLKLYGPTDVVLNSSLGEFWGVVGKVTAANTQSSLRVARAYYDRPLDQWRSNVRIRNGAVNVASTVANPIVIADVAGAQARLDSDKPEFNTVLGAVLDGEGSVDEDSFPRGVARKEPPSILETDPQNNQNRYLALTRNSGRIVNGQNIGRFGWGRGVYVDSSERGNTDNEDERAISGAVKALANDWLNPNNPASQGWRGPYYIPLAAYLRLLPDGFEVVRDTRSRSPYWRLPTGGSTGSTRARFRTRVVEYPLGSGSFQPMILDSVQNPQLTGRPGASLTDDDFRQFGQLFNGVIFFEGDVRVRGVIATNQQYTVVSMGTVYVDGSITKGVVDERTGQSITIPSTSAVALLAKDYVCVNTTMFFGPAPGENVDEKNENAVPDTPNPFELKLEDPDIVLEAQFLLDPLTPAALGGNPLNPSTWRPYANTYVEAGTNNPLPAQLLINSSADDNGPAFVSFDVAPGSYSLVGGWGNYLFPRDLVFGANSTRFNAAAEFFGGVGNIPVYGLGNPTLNAYPKFETVEFPIVTSSFTYTARQLQPTNGTLGSFIAAVEDPTWIRVRMNGVGQTPMKNYLAGKTAIAPHDVRIEAAMFAENGSFFVIPGNWFNTNTQDTRRNWLDRSAGSLYANMNNDQANQRRFELFGHTPSVPFYAEPLDVKVSISGSVSENVPASINAQAEWLKKWGWIPRYIGSTGLRIPLSHTSGFDPNLVPTIPNLIISHDPVFSAGGVYDPNSNLTLPARRDEYGNVLPPMPRLPVSPTLAYFGEVNP